MSILSLCTLLPLHEIQPNLCTNLGIDYSVYPIQLYPIMINYLQVIFGRNYIAYSIFASRYLLQGTPKRMDPLKDRIKQQSRLGRILLIGARQIRWIT